MGAFEQAWVLLKAPLDMDSIRDVGTVMQGRFPFHQFEADFIDPETNERLPAVARLSPDGLGVAHISDNEPDDMGHRRWRAEHYIHPTSLMGSSPFDNQISFDTIDDPRGIYPYSIKTEPGYEGRGYQEALIQLILRLAENQNRRMYEPPLHMMSEQGLGFMRRLREKHAGDDRVGRPNP